MIRFRGMTSFTRYNALGEPFTVYREVPLVQRVDDKFLDCSAYVYATEDHANEGKSVGASGFLVAVPATGKWWLLDGVCPAPGYNHLYVVTNRHNIVEREDSRPKPVVRLNTENVAPAIIPATVEDWVCSDEHDLAVLPIQYRKHYRYLAIPVASFLTREEATTYDVGIGDEVMMVGRFVNHEGKQQNRPSVRFGHVSMMPCESEPLPHKSSPSGSQVSFAVEVHSIPGYSGSPVIVRPSPVPVSKIPAEVSITNTTIGIVHVSPCDFGPAPRLRGGPWLLGVEWGVIRDKFYESSRDHYYYTGMSGVVPAWYLADLLNKPRLVNRRRAEQETLREHHRNCGTTETAPSELPS